MKQLKYNDAVGLPVVCAGNGKKAGVVKNVILNPAEREVTAFILERKGVEIGKKQVLFKDVLSIGSDALVINDEKVITELSNDVKNIGLKDYGHVIGLHVFEKTGTEIGVVSDVSFDTGSGRIESLDVSDGLLQDIVAGRRILPLLGRVEFSEEYIIVEREAVEEMVNNGGGIKNRLLS